MTAEESGTNATDRRAMVDAAVSFAMEMLWQNTERLDVSAGVFDANWGAAIASQDSLFIWVYNVWQDDHRAAERFVAELRAWLPDVGLVEVGFAHDHEVAMAITYAPPNPKIVSDELLLDTRRLIEDWLDRRLAAEGFEHSGRGAIGDACRLTYEAAEDADGPSSEVRPTHADMDRLEGALAEWPRDLDVLRERFRDPHRSRDAFGVFVHSHDDWLSWRKGPAEHVLTHLVQFDEERARIAGRADEARAVRDSESTE
jgi:hypothetical protein